VVIFQSVFYSEMHQNNIFFILKKLFLTLAQQNNLKTLTKYINLKQNIKKINFLKYNNNQTSIRGTNGLL